MGTLADATIFFDRWRQRAFRRRRATLAKNRGSSSTRPDRMQPIGCKKPRLFALPQVLFRNGVSEVLVDIQFYDPP